MQLADGYKQTGVGVIPEDWCADLLDLHCHRGSGHTPNKKVTKYYTGQIVWVSLADSGLLDSGEISRSSITVSKDGIANSSAVLHPKGIVLLSRDAGVGKSAVAGCDLAVSQHFITWQCNEESLHNWFLYYWLQHQKREFERIAIGSTIKTIGLPYFKKYQVPLPPLAEQRAIAEALSDVDALINALDALITKKRHIKQGTMQQLLTGKKRLPRFTGDAGNFQRTEAGVLPTEWNVDTVDSVTPRGMKYGIVDGPFGSNLKTIHYRTSGVPIITSGFVTEGKFVASNYIYVDEEKFRQEKRSAVHGGDIVMAKIGARCGASAILPENHDPGILSGNALKITVDEERHSTYFIWQLLWALYASGNTDEMTSVGAQPAVSMPLLKRHLLPLPPLAEQRAIVDVIRDMDAEITALEQKRNKTKLIKQGMMQELLTGKTRLT